MDKQPVGQLPDLTQSNNDDEIMVITNSEYNQLKKEKISDFITDLTSTDENNAIVKGTDGKLFTKDFGNASNITEGTLPVSVLPNIPKDKLPEIETDDLPDSGITAGTYTYPTDIVVNSKGQVTSITEGQPGANNANQDLSNLGPLGLDKLNQSKALETGAVSSDADVYADVLKYAHSTFDLSKFEVVGSPNITNDGILNTNNTYNTGVKLSSTITQLLETANNWIIETPTIFLENLSTSMEPLIATDIVYRGTNIGLKSSGIVFYVYSSTSTGEQKIINAIGLSPSILEIGHIYKFRIKYDNTSGYELLYSKDGNNFISIYQNSTVEKIGYSSALLTSGFLGTNNWKLSNNIDLKSFAIWADGVPVFNGNKTGTDTINEIEIPYTLSKTGSKIVDVAYRDRVQDLYEQTGEALFYTIDEENENFTLPMGEIYGMIERKNDELNNPFSLFDYKYADAPIYNMSWLQANGSWYAKSVYISAYEALVVENNSDITAGTTTTLPSGGSYTKRGLSVKLSTDSYTDTDFVINTTDETFRLPLKAALTPVTGGSIPVIGNGKAMGFTNAVNSQVLTLKSFSDGAELDTNGGGQTLPYNVGGFNRPQQGNVVGLSTDASMSGVIADISASTGLYLYYYVGETTQSPYIINNSQKLNNDATNLTEPGKTNIKNLVYPDFNNTVSLDTTLNLVQQADKDCYLHVSAGSNSDLSVDICDADGVTKLTLISSDTVANVATIQTSPLIPAGTYFKVSRNVGSYNSLTKIYTKGESNV